VCVCVALKLATAQIHPVAWTREGGGIGQCNINGGGTHSSRWQRFETRLERSIQSPVENKRQRHKSLCSKVI